MIGMGNSPEHADAIRAVAAEYVRHHGCRKRGLAAFAEALGIGLRAARAIYDREWIAVSEERLAAALRARAALRLQRRAALLRELEEIEGELHGTADGGPGRAMDGGPLAGCRDLVRHGVAFPPHAEAVTG